MFIILADTLVEMDKIKQINNKSTNQTIFSRALLDADFGPVGRKQHPARLRERTLS